jgi:hypothetical protein
VVIHRAAASDAVKGKGIGTVLFRMIEELCTDLKVYSIKVERPGKAFEKVITES